MPKEPAAGKTGWFTGHRKWAWLAALLVIYTLTGFFMLPLLLEKLVVDKVRQDLGREASFQKIEVNPYQLALRAHGFELTDTDGAKLAGFDQFYVNFEASSLFRWAWTFQQVSLDGLDLLIERFEPADSRLGRLLSDLQANQQQPDAETPGDKGIPPLLIQELRLGNGRLRIRDQVPQDTASLDIGPIDVSILELNTLPDRFGQQTVTVQFPDQSSLEWQGNIDLQPFQSEGTLALSNLQLAPAIAYLKAVMPIDSLAAALSTSTHYRLSAETDGGWSIELDELQLEVTDVSVAGLSPATEILTASRLALTNGVLRYPEKSLTFEMAEIDAPAARTWLDENRKFSLLQLRPEQPAAGDHTASADQATDAAPDPWSFELRRLQLADGTVEFSDRSISPPGLVSINLLRLTAEGINNMAGHDIPVSLAGELDQGGSFEISGNAAILPSTAFIGTATLNDIALVPAQPYLGTYSAMSIASGALDAQIEISLAPESPLSVAGSTMVRELAVTDTRRDESLVAWQQLEIDRFEWVADTSILQLSLLSFDQPFGRFRINEDQSTNLSGLLIEGQPAAEPAAEPDDLPDDEPGGQNPAEQPVIVIGGISVSDGSLDFADLSLPLQFATKISDMDGSISTIDSSSTEPANIRLEGQVDEFGLARIEGSMAVLDPIGHTDVSVEFRNLLMSNLSPYTVKFAGREIDQGKLDLDLGYSIEQGRLDATNSVVLSDLVIGDQVESPEATNLPLDLAVALLKDSEGMIKLDLPVTGDVNNPEFKISGVVMQAIATVLTKIVSAPFRLLGSLIGIDSEDLGQFQFLAGRSDLTPPELEKVQQLQAALQQRPELNVEITGPYDPLLDVPKLQYFRLRDEVLTRLGQQATEQAEEIEMLDDEIRSVLEDLFKQRFPQTPLDSIRDEHRSEASGLDDLAYAADLRDRLLASENITTADLESLASERADAIRTAFLANGEFSESRITLGTPAQVESAGDEWVVTELGVATE